MTAKVLSELFGLEIVGNIEANISNVAKLEDAKEGDLTFFSDSKYVKYLKDTKATVIIVKKDFTDYELAKTYIKADNPYIIFLMIVDKFFKPIITLDGIDVTACIEKSCNVECNVAIGKNVVISANSSIGKDTKIFHNCVIGENVKMGENCLIYPNVSIADKTVIGNNVIIYSGAVIGTDGFGYLRDENGNHVKIPQIGNVVIEDDVEIGANTCIDRAALGSTVIKKGTKLDNLVQIGHNVQIGEQTAISSQTGVSGSTKIGSYCTFGGQVGLADHIEIGDKVMIGAKSGVSRSIPSNNAYMGIPAKDFKKFTRIEAHIRNIEDYANRIKILEKTIEELKNKL